MVPTKTRNTSAHLISYKNENILVDCGEGTQRQLRKAKIRQFILAMNLTDQGSLIEDLLQCHR